METETMGRVLTEATIENLQDLWDAQRQRIPDEQVRRVTVPDALVDTGASTLSLPGPLIRQLGLGERYKKRVRTASGVVEVGVYEAVRLIIQGRDVTVDVLEAPEGTPVLIGQIPLEHLDLVVNPRSRSLTGNPEHDGEWMFEMY
jgi:clan AA aspartic protease